jgi:putative hydrolase of the HAD superfamily
MSIRVICFDADGVVVNPMFQFARLLDEEYGITLERTRGFFKGVFNDCLVGKADLRTALEPFLAGWGWNGTVDEFIAIWLRADHVIDANLMAIIQDLRGAGVLCCLATNQERNRADYMRIRMGFQTAFDRLFFSCELGCQKPDPAYFRQIQQALGFSPDELFLWDDSQANVDSARACGWNGERYEGSCQLSALSSQPDKKNDHEAHKKRTNMKPQLSL